MSIKKDRSKYTLFLICLCVASIAMCQNLMAPNLTKIAVSYNITDQVERDARMGGQLSTAFFVFSMPFFVTIGYMTDRYDRKKLLLVVTGINSISTLLTAFTSTFAHLFLLRIFSGATVMSILPLGYSVLGDLFPPKSRGAMGTWLIVSMGAGTILGQLMSGLLGPTIGWRMTFIFASLPGTMMALWTSNVLTMPKRGEMDNKRSVEMVDLENPIDRHSNNNNNKINGSDSSSNGNNNSSGGTNKNKYSTILDSNDVADNDRDSGNLYSFKEDNHFIIQDTLDTNAIGSNNTNRNNSTTKLIKVIFSTKSNLLLFAQCIPGSIPWGVLFVFMNDFLAQDKGLTVEQATMMISLFGVGAAIGGAIGGVLGQKMYNIKPQYLSLFMGVVRRLRLMVMK